MISVLLGKILRYSQTLGREDILTAILATMLDCSTGLRSLFLREVGVLDSGIINDLSGSVEIKTGVYYRLSDDVDGISIRPDMLISNFDFSWNDSGSSFVLIESKLKSDLTPNQYVGYPEIKRNHNDRVAIILISNYYKKHHKDYFDCVVSWSFVFEIIKNYISKSEDNIECSVLRELLDTFYEFGIKYDDFLFSYSPEEVSSYLNFSGLVKQFRRQMGVTQEEFSKKIGVALTIVRGLEQSSHKGYNTKSINKILDYFDMELGAVKKKNT